MNGFGGGFNYTDLCMLQFMSNDRKFMCMCFKHLVSSIVEGEEKREIALAGSLLEAPLLKIMVMTMTKFFSFHLGHRMMSAKNEKKLAYNNNFHHKTFRGMNEKTIFENNFNECSKTFKSRKIRNLLEDKIISPFHDQKDFLRRRQRLIDVQI